MPLDIPNDVQEYIGRTFPTEQRLTVLNALSSAVIGDRPIPYARLLRCVVVGSQGNMATLIRLIGLLRIDWRDVIVAGEYDNDGNGRLIRVHDFSAPIPS